MSDAVVLDASALARFMSDPSGPVAAHLEKLALQVEAAAKRFCPVDTGRLRASITHLLAEDEQGPVAYVGSNVEYAIYQEMGTYKMAAQPYLRPALIGVQSGAGALNAVYEASQA